MSERVTQMKQVLDTLNQVSAKQDQLTQDVSGIKEDIAGIKKQIDMQPIIDNGRFESFEKSEKACQASFEKQFKDVNVRVDTVEEVQTWWNRLAIVEGLGIILSLIGLVFSMLTK